MTISNFVAYVKQAWKNKPDTSTPLSAARLTHLEDGIKGNSDAIEKIAAAVVSQIVNDPNKIASMASLYSVNQAVTQLNSDLASITGLIVKDITLNPGYAIYGTWATRIIKDKSSGICVINLAIRKADNSVINTNTYVDIGILPDGFLPIYPTGASGIGEEPGAINHPVGIILFEGKIKATTYGENTRNIIASFSYSTN
jgi:hypothetical protein